ncbi:MAG: protein translocase subunit SecD [Proteobacteria bacterium]|nr:protein translocase subunit SecD [Pseudomonadota bacterium]
MKKNLLILVATVIVSFIILVPTFAPLALPEDARLPEWWPSKKIKLGLDLRGGSYLVLGVQTKEAVKSQLTSIASAVKADMAKERIGIIRAKALTDRTIQVTLLNDKGIEKLDDYFRKEFPQLQKAESSTDESRVLVTYKISEERAKEIERNAVDQAIETIRNRVDQYGVAEPTIQRSGEKRIVVQLPDVTNVESVKKSIGSVAKLEFRLLSDPAKPEVESVSLKSRSGEIMRVDDDVLLTGDAIKNATVEMSPRTNEVEVSMHFNSVGAQIFDRIAAENYGRNLAIVLDNVVQSAPRINSTHFGGSAQITGGFSTEEAHRLAVVLRSGALPAPLTFEEQRTVGASLGADSINKGIYASLIGSVLVIIFMISYYRKSGVVAIVCLTINMAWLLAMLAVFGSTLTLPGIAGLALTIGMAVDSNIIIYERIREELRNGVSNKASVDAGFLKAHWTILDANITTILSGLILYGFGTGPIKGFAVTLSIGIITTVAAALFATRVCFSAFKLEDSKGKLSI